MATRKAAPFATDVDDGLQVPKEHSIGSGKVSPFKPVDTGVPYAKDDSERKMQSMSKSDYGAGVTQAVYSGRAGPRLGDSGGKCPYATSDTAVPAFDKPPPKRTTAAPFAMDN
mmetsp:Transcript_35486/g.92818  ORF Transcript_35486/g.92818 Transcript_35486/m.92818 type:complete len:113 (+) Transcript_35486:63-401(+)